MTTYAIYVPAFTPLDALQFMQNGSATGHLGIFKTHSGVRHSERNP